MSNLDMHTWMIVALGLMVGVVIGSLIVYAIMRPKPGQKTVSQVQAELDDYKSQVSQHFSTTSELFKQMTGNYRSLYQHMATGATSLCDADAVAPELELAAAEMLPKKDHQTNPEATRIPETPDTDTSQLARSDNTTAKE